MPVLLELDLRGHTSRLTRILRRQIAGRAAIDAARELDRAKDRSFARRSVQLALQRRMAASCGSDNELITQRDYDTCRLSLATTR